MERFSYQLPEAWLEVPVIRPPQNVSVTPSLKTYLIHCRVNSRDDLRSSHAASAAGAGRCRGQAVQRSTAGAAAQERAGGILQLSTYSMRRPTCI